MIELERLRAIAEKAAGTWDQGTILSSANDEYVETFDPDTALRLLEVVEAASRVRRYRPDLRHYDEEAMIALGAMVDALAALEAQPKQSEAA